MRVSNEHQYLDSNARLEAEGYQWRNAQHGPRRTLLTSPDQKAPGGFVYERNGGLVVMRRVLLGAGDRLVRFSTRVRNSSEVRNEDHLNSPWWMSEDHFRLLLSRARSAAARLVETARRQLAIPDDWSPADIMVTARVRDKVTLAAHAGPGQTAVAGADRRVIANDYAPYYAADHYMDQLYIPGLGRHPWLPDSPPNGAPLWLAFERTFDPNAPGWNP